MKKSFLKENKFSLLKSKLNKSLLAFLLIFAVLTNLSAEGTEGAVGAEGTERAETFSMPFKPGLDKIYSLFSPDLAVEKALGYSGSSPFGIMLNPAAGTLFAQKTIEVNYSQGFGKGLSYLAPASSDPTFNAFGYFFNTGMTIPTREGSFTLLGSFLYSNAKYFPVEMLTGGGFYYSRLIKDNFAIGAGIKAYGSLIPTVDAAPWFFSADFGILHAPQNIKHVNRFLWGFALKNIGWENSENKNTFLSLFTPEINLDFDFFEKDKTTLNFFTSANLPALQSFELQTGLSVKYDQMISFALATTLRLDDLLNDPRRYTSLYPSILFKYTYRSKNYDKHEKDFSTEIATSTLALENQVWSLGFGLKGSFGLRQPTLSFDLKNYIYLEEDIFYATYKGIKYEEIDEIKSQNFKVYAIPQSNKDLENFNLPLRLNRIATVESFNIRIYNKANKLVLAEEIFPENIIDTNEDYFKLDVLYPITAKDLQFGVYQFEIEAVEASGKIHKTGKYEFLYYDLSYLYVRQPETNRERFSYDNQGYFIKQFGSYEREWQYSVYSELLGVVEAGTINNGQPEDYLWKGLINGSLRVPDGIFSYEISTTTKRGSILSGGIKTFYLDSGDIKTKLDLQTNIFDPSAHKGFKLLATTENIRNISWWKIAILDKEGETVYETDKNFSIPAEYIYNGRDNSGKILPTGFYSARLSVSYNNGDVRIALSDNFEIR